MILVGDLNASRERKRIGYVDGSNTVEYDKQLAESYSTEIGGKRLQAASTLSNQLSYHSPDGSHSAQLDDVWVLNAPSSMLHDDFHMAVRQPTSQVLIIRPSIHVFLLVFFLHTFPLYVLVGGLGRWLIWNHGVRPWMTGRIRFSSPSPRA